jgi:DNA-binding MarR family transcriptional regulator
VRRAAGCAIRPSPRIERASGPRYVRSATGGAAAITEANTDVKAPKTELPSDDAQNKLISIWQQTMEPWRDMQRDMPLQYVYSFILVCLYEGRGVQELADLAGVPQETMSRHLDDIGDRNRRFEPGFGLVEKHLSRNNMSKKSVLLTAKGKNLSRKLAETLERIRELQ